VKVTELSQDQLEELRGTYYYDEENDEAVQEYDCPDDVPDEVLFEHYADIDFVMDDFWCTSEDIPLL
jgi:hypothetical protein